MKKISRGIPLSFSLRTLWLKEFSLLGSFLIGARRSSFWNFWKKLLSFYPLDLIRVSMEERPSYVLTFDGVEGCLPHLLLLPPIFPKIDAPF